MAYRQLSASPEAQLDYDSFLQELETAITEGRRDPNEIVRDTLYQIYFGPLCTAGEGDKLRVSSELLTPTGRAVLHSLDPRNITTEPEYYTDIDNKLYLVRKPYIWLWQMFDRSPLGQNALVGHRLRRML